MSALSGTGTSGGPDIESAAGDPDGGGEPLSRDDTFEVLANHRRRYAIHYLQHHGDTAELGTLAEHVAAWENDIAVEAVTADERKRAYTSLQQFHLPKMDDLRVVDYDSRAGTVELTEPATELEIHLEIVDEYDIPWSLYYLGLAVTGGVLSALSMLSVGPFAAIPVAAWAVFLVAALAVSALVHTCITYHNRLGERERPPGVEVN